MLFIYLFSLVWAYTQQGSEFTSGSVVGVHSCWCLGGTYVMLGIESGLGTCKANTLTPVLFLQPMQ